MGRMKKQAVQPVGVIDALSAGLNAVLRYPWPLAIPVVVDLLLWLAPRVSVAQLLQRLYAGWEALAQAFYSPAQLASMSEALGLMREAIAQVGSGSNLMAALAGSWLAPPSALVDAQGSRLKLISDGVLAPVGFGLDLPAITPGPGQASALEVPNIWSALAIIVGLWLVSQILAAAYFRWAAHGLASAPGPEGSAEAGQAPNGPQMRLLPLALRFVGLGIVLGIVMMILRLPLALATALTLFSGSSGISLVLVFSGGLVLWLTLWFLVAFFFTSEALVLDGQPLWAGLWQSMILVRRNSPRVLGLVILINLIMLGFRAVWGLIGQTPLGVLIAIFGNAFLGTAMLYAIFVYYASLRAQALGPLPKADPGAPNA